MHNELITFLNKFNQLDQTQINQLALKLNTKLYQKNTIIVKQGQICNLCYFVLKGCVRQFVIEDGVDKTIGIYTEEQAINFFNEQQSAVKSNSFLCAVEDTILLVGNPEKDEQLFNEFPVLIDITRKMIESDFGKTQQEFAHFITSSPLERYQNLLKTRPEVVQRVSQVIIASYLGITPESLSRIRKRIKSIQLSE